MNKTFSFVFLLLISCQSTTPDKRPDASPTPLLIESVTIQQTRGNCDLPEPNQCADISLKYPLVKNGPRALQEQMASWSHDFLISLLDAGLEMDEETSLSSAVEGFFAMHEEWTTEMPDLPGNFAIEVTDTILLLNEQYLTLRMDAYSYTGGAHPNATSAIATFDIKTGKIIQPVDLVKDLEKLHARAEEKFREMQQEAFEDGFEFDESWPFVIASNVGLTTEGLFFCYVPYEVAPYVMGFTEFVIPYIELEKL